MEDEGLKKQVLYGLDLQDTLLFIGKMSLQAEAFAKETSMLRGEMKGLIRSQSDGEALRRRVADLERSNTLYEKNNRALDAALVELRARHGAIKEKLKDTEEKLEKATRKKPRTKKRDK